MPAHQGSVPATQDERTADRTEVEKTSLLPVKLVLPLREHPRLAGAMAASVVGCC